MPNIYVMERDEEPYGTSGVETTGWRSSWIVQWTRTKIVNPVVVILRRWVSNVLLDNIFPLQVAFQRMNCVLLQISFSSLLMSRGSEPKQLAFSAALGFTLGVFPIYGITALLCGVAMAILGSRCNGPTLILVNLLATPFELGLMIPFLRVGETLVGASPFPLTKDALWQALTGKASGDLLFAIGHAILGWLFVGPFLCLALYFILLPVIRWSQQRFGGQDRVPSERVVLLNEEILLGKKDLSESD